MLAYGALSGKQFERIEVESKTGQHETFDTRVLDTDLPNTFSEITFTNVEVDMQFFSTCSCPQLKAITLCNCTVQNPGFMNKQLMLTCKYIDRVTMDTLMQCQLPNVVSIYHCEIQNVYPAT